MPEIDFPAVNSVEALCGLSNPVQLGSVVARSGAVERLPPWFAKLGVNDWALCLLMAQTGAIGYIPQVLSAYRVHRDGWWTRLTPTERVFQTLKTLVRLRPALSAPTLAALDISIEGLADWWVTQGVFDDTLAPEQLAQQLASADDVALRACLIRTLIAKARHIGVSNAWHENQHHYWKNLA